MVRMSNLPFFDYEFNVDNWYVWLCVGVKIIQVFKNLQLLVTKVWKALIIAPSLEIGDFIVQIRN